MAERIRVGDRLPFFLYDTPYSAGNRFRDLLDAQAPLVLVFMFRYRLSVANIGWAAIVYAYTCYGFFTVSWQMLVIRCRRRRAQKRAKKPVASGWQH